MFILDAIVDAKQSEIIRRQKEHPEAELIEMASAFQKTSFADALGAGGIRVIAEVKYGSPSHGPFGCQLPPSDVAAGYAAAGAAAISVLTDEDFFDGRPEFVTEVYKTLESRGDRLPVLRKDFLLDRYQVAEAAAWGASAYLLIVSCLTPPQLAELIAYGSDLGLQALVEVHDEFELETAVMAGAGIIGVNNRNLNTFETSLAVSFRLARVVEGETGLILVAESGLSEPAQLLELSDAGFAAFLIGGSLMETPHPGETLARLLLQLGAAAEPPR